MGGGGGDGGAGEARRQEEERQARIKAATDAINATFNRKKTFIVGPDGKRYSMVGPELETSENRRRFLGSNNPISLGGGLWDEAGNFVDIPGFSFSPFGGMRLPEGYTAQTVSEREDMYGQQRGAVFDLNKMDVDRQATEAERFNRFGLARSGLMGGSAQIDSMADINRRTNEGLLRAGGIADQAAADLRTADEQARANLISLAQSGIDTGTAASQAMNALKVNNANAASARAGATVGGLFNDLSQAYLMNQQMAGRAAAAGPNNQQWYGVSSTRSGDSGRVTR